MKEFDRIEVLSRDALHAWLAAHHRRADRVWIVTDKRIAETVAKAHDDIRANQYRQPKSSTTAR